MALVFVDIIQSNSPAKRNQFATEVIRYAMSNIDNVSTYFWKSLLELNSIHPKVNLFRLQILHLTLDNMPFLVYNGTINNKKG